jgi:4-amino-4-deoxy-L-arabinose transferase-like glycosyltransferase
MGTYKNNEEVQYYEDVGIAINLLHGKGYVYRSPWGLGPLRPTAAKAPMYPLLISVVFWIFGVNNFLALFTLQSLLSSLTCVLLFFCLKNSASYRSGVLAGFAMAIYPPFVYHAVTKPESTTLSLFMICFFIYQLVKLKSTSSSARWLFTSFTSGLLVLTEPVTFPFVCLSFLYLAYVAGKSWTIAFQKLLLVGIVFVSVVGPWTLRNYIMFKHFVFIKSNLSWTFVDGLSRAGIKFPIRPGAKEVAGLNEAEEDRVITRAVIRWIRGHRSIYVKFLAKNIKDFWWETDSYKNSQSRIYVLGRRIPYLLLLAVSIPGIVCSLVRIIKPANLALGENIFEIVALGLMVTYTGVHMVIGAFLLRYHFPVELVMFGFLDGSLNYLKGLLPVRSTSP